MQFEFRVLGPLEVRRDGETVSLSGAKRRLLLADLLVRPGRVVTIDRLVEDLWPHGAPGDAPHAIQQHVSLLRKALGDTDRTHVREQPPGYVLDVDPGAVDAVRFERLLAEARDAATSDPARAATRASEALALWRGEAYADVAYEGFAQGEIARLTELRLEAEEERIDAELALGRSAELIGELEALVTAAPTRERRWGQLMRTLARAGRQADALRAYQLARKHLLDELGLEPGDQLRELQRRILQGDASLVEPPRKAPPPRVSRRLVTVVAVEPDLSLDLDPEEHDRETRRAADVVDAIASRYGAERPEPFVLAFPHEDQWDRATAAAAEIQEQVGSKVGLATGEALVGDGSLRGPLIARARAHAHEGIFEIPTSVLAERAEPPFVGRRAELEQLGASRAAVVVGTPGIGKSRLARELARSGRAVFGRCTSYGAQSLAPLREIASALGSPDALADAWAAEVPLTFRRLCESVGEPLLVVFDDVQWADALVLETIEHLVMHAPEQVRVVCLAREELLEEHPTFLPAADRIVLHALPSADAAALAAHLTSDPPVVERALAAAEGNPLFIEQFVAHASEGGASLPPTLQAVLAARLDRLAPTERRAVEHAAVIGREFDAPLLVELVGARDAVASLVRRGFIEPAPTVTPFEERLRFSHALIQEAAYASSSKAERSQLHARIADLIAERAPDEVVGFHLERAATLRPNRDAEAARLALEAGGRLAHAGIAAWQRGDAAAATQLLLRALDLLPDEDERVGDLLCELGTALNTLGDRDTAVAALERAAGRDEPRVRLRAQIEKAAIDVVVGSRGAAAKVIELADEAASVLEAAGDDRALGRTWMLAGWIRGGAHAQHEAWREAAERALTYYRRAGWPAATCVGHIAQAIYNGPTPAAEGIARCRDLLAHDVEDLVAEANVSVHLAGLHAMAEQFTQAEELFARARSVYTELGRMPSLVTACDPAQARAARLRGDDDAAAAIFLAGCETLLREHRSFHLASQAAELADVLCALGRVDEASEWSAVAERHLTEDDLWGRIVGLIARTRVQSAVGREDEARAAAREAVELSARTDDLNLRASALVASGEAANDAAAFAEADALYAQKGNTAAAHRLSRRRAAAATPSS